MKTRFIFLLISIFWVSSCNQQSNSSSTEKKDKKGTVEFNKKDYLKTELGGLKCIDKPFKNIDVAYDEYEVEVTKPNKFTYKTGTEVEIPANAFVYEDKTPVRGKVKVSYRELHSPSEIIASGITMTYDSLGKRKPFKTAGMFDIKGEANGKEVFLAQNKEVKINMSSQQEGRFNLYYLEKEGDKGWQFLNATASEKVNTEDKNFLKEPVEPLKPVKFNSATDLVFPLNINYSKYPPLRALNGLMWKYAGNKSQAEVKILLTKKWKNVRLAPKDEKKLLYTLVMNGKKEERVDVTPVLSGKFYKEAIAKYEQAKRDYKEQKRIVAARKKMNEFGAKVMRFASVKKMGVYNCDVMSRIQSVPMYVDFQLPKNKDYDAFKVYHILETENAIFSVNCKRKAQIRLDANGKNKMVLIFQSGKVAVLKSDYIAQKLDEISKSSNAVKLAVELKDLPKTESELSSLISKG